MSACVKSCDECGKRISGSDVYDKCNCQRLEKSPSSIGSILADARDRFISSPIGNQLTDGVVSGHFLANRIRKAWVLGATWGRCSSMDNDASDDISDSDIVDWLEMNSSKEWPYGNEATVYTKVITPKPFDQRPSIRDAVKAAIRESKVKKREPRTEF